MIDQTETFILSTSGYENTYTLAEYMYSMERVLEDPILCKELLVQNIGETEAAYLNRVKRSIVENYFRDNIKEISSSMVMLPVSYEGIYQDELKNFNNNVDGEGTSITTLARTFGHTLEFYGSVLWIINVSTNGKGTVYPRITAVPPSRVESLTLDYSGDFPAISRVVIRLQDNQNSFKKKITSKHTMYDIFTYENTVVYRKLQVTESFRHTEQFIYYLDSGIIPTQMTTAGSTTTSSNNLISENFKILEETVIKSTNGKILAGYITVDSISSGFYTLPPGYNIVKLMWNLLHVNSRKNVVLDVLTQPFLKLITDITKTDNSTRGVLELHDISNIEETGEYFDNLTYPQMDSWYNSLGKAQYATPAGVTVYPMPKGWDCEFVEHSGNGMKSAYTEIEKLERAILKQTIRSFEADNKYINTATQALINKDDRISPFQYTMLIVQEALNNILSCILKDIIGVKNKENLGIYRLPQLDAMKDAVENIDPKILEFLNNLVVEKKIKISSLINYLVTGKLNLDAERELFTKKEAELGDSVVNVDSADPSNNIDEVDQYNNLEDKVNNNTIQINKSSENSLQDKSKKKNEKSSTEAIQKEIYNNIIG